MSNDAAVQAGAHGHGDGDRQLTAIFSAYTITATLWLLFATAIGLLLAFKFGAPDFWAAKYLSFGRLRPIHTNGTFYGWASIALVGLAYDVAARSCGTRLYSTRLAWIGLWLFNIAAVAGTIALELGYNEGDLEYREWPWPIRLIFLAALIVTAWNLIGTVARRTSDDIYLSNWYTMGALLWTCVIAIVAILPWYQHGLGQVAISGYYMHNAVGMWFTPLALGVFYYAIPKIMSRPIYSYALGVFAFWTNLCFYPLLGGLLLVAHFLTSPFLLGLTGRHSRRMQSASSGECIPRFFMASLLSTRILASSVMEYFRVESWPTRSLSFGRMSWTGFCAPSGVCGASRFFTTLIM